MTCHRQPAVLVLIGVVLLAIFPIAPHVQARSIGPDSYGYIGTDEFTFSWEEIAPDHGGSGIEIASLTGHDDLFAAVPLGFGFRFYGTRYTNIWVSINGLLAFNEQGLSNVFETAAIPDPALPNSLIAVFWDDLNLWPGQKIYYALLGSEPYRRLVIQYHGAAHFNDPNARYYFQVVLYETWNQIRMQYLDMQNGPSFFLGDGRNATLGIENANGTEGLQWSRNEMHSVSNGMCIVFYPEVLADLQIRKQSAPQTVLLHSDLIYTLIVSNAGPDAATEIRVDDVLPAGVKFREAITSQGTADYEGGIVTCLLGTLEENASAVVTIRVQVAASGVLTNIATVTALQTDPDPSNNTATRIVTVGTRLQNDFNRDGKSDLSVYDASRARWYARTLDGNIIGWDTAWGFAGATPAAADYNGDGRTDLAVYSADNGRWYIRSASGTILGWEIGWGFPGTLAVPGDYNGNGAFDLGVYNPADGKWYIRTLSGIVLTNGASWGFPGAIPVPGDYNGDGRYDLAVYHPATGKWYIRSLSGKVLAWGANWGFADAAPVPGDYNGNGTTDLAVYHAGTGRWYIRRLDGPILAWEVSHGFPGTYPVAGDFDGDLINDLAIYYPATGRWYIRKLTGKVIAWEEKWGWSAAEPVQAQYWINRAFGL